ncbi:MAG: AAA family ATPase [Chitinivibrionales bacterium]|nr:AAA family ATPase [Chitinivibrionales bacterium]MBD3356803.1 AAA family ATPase [Chitinivibrionales bacterium]
MVKKELIRRSPLRILENSIHGGVGAGNIGVIAARKGVGKTACLVHIATDQLFQDRHVLHVSFLDSTEHIVSWYEDIFREVARRSNLDCAMDVHDSIIKNRVIMNFRQDGIHITEIEKSIRELIDDGGFAANTVIIDGYDFARSSTEELREFRTFSEKLGLELWFSAELPGDLDEQEGGSVPETLRAVADELSVVICLRPTDDFIRLELVKDHDAPSVADMHLKLDPATLLIAEE